MKAQGSRDDPKLHTRPQLTRDGAKPGYSCTCIKTTPKSGQAWRGHEGARMGVGDKFWYQVGQPGRKAKKRPPEGGQGLASLR